MRKYFYTDGVNKFGPYSKEELKTQKISRGTKIWYLGLENWTELSQIKELEELILNIPPDIKPIKPSFDEKIKNTELEPISKIIPLAIKINKYHLKHWGIAIVLSFFIAFIINNIIRNQSEYNLYKDIVASSYEADEKFDVYIEKFYRDLEFYGIFPKKPKKTIIKFSRLDQLENTTHIHGLSLGSNDDNRIEIYINPSSWKQFSKPMRYYLMYHELSHDILNVKDLEKNISNEGKLMYPEISSYEKKNMDDFIESYQTLFQEQSSKWKNRK
jgi:hypothetical protein